MSRNRFTLNRRQLLAATGLLAGSLFLPSRAARAQVGPPKRLIVLFTQHGVVYDNWKFRPGNQPDGTTFDLGPLAENEFSPILQPLHPFRDKLCVVDGLSLASAEADVLANGHDVGTRHALTGKLMASGAGGGPSVDQIVAGKIKQAGRIDSLELSVLNAVNGGAVWRDAGQSIPTDNDPNSVFNRVFPPPTDSGGLSPDDRVRAAQPSVLDLVQNEFDVISKKLGAEDQQKLALHRDLVRGVEQRLIDLANVQCTRPGAPQLDNNGDVALYDSRASAMFQLAAAAVSCDLTRVITIQMAQLSTAHLGAPPGDVHADIAHQVDISDTAKQFMTTYGNVHARHLAELLALLDSIPEGSGTVLDNCVVVWANELADSTHHFHPWPAVAAGGLLPSAGKYIALTKDTPNPSHFTTFPGYEPTLGPPHNRFWVAVANAVGADVDAVGETALSTPDGGSIDCTGSLEEMA